MRIRLLRAGAPAAAELQPSNGARHAKAPLMRGSRAVGDAAVTVVVGG
jgi:hypothetical protein